MTDSSNGSPHVHVDVVSDVVCPWCYIGKHRLEGAIARTPEIAVDVDWRPYFLNPWIPREGIDRKTYLETKFGSVQRYDAIAERVAAAAARKIAFVYFAHVAERQLEAEAIQQRRGTSDRGQRGEAAGAIAKADKERRRVSTLPVPAPASGPKTAGAHYRQPC